MRNREILWRKTKKINTKKTRLCVYGTSWNCLRFLGYLHFLFSISLILLALWENWDTTFSLSTLTSLCTVISATVVNLSSSVLFRRYIFSHFRIEKLLSTEIVVTGNTITLNSKTFWRGPSPPGPLPCLRHWYQSIRTFSKDSFCRHLWSRCPWKNYSMFTVYRVIQKESNRCRVRRYIIFNMYESTF